MVGTAFGCGNTTTPPPPQCPFSLSLPLNLPPVFLQPPVKKHVQQILDRLRFLLFEVHNRNLANFYETQEHEEVKTFLAELRTELNI